MGYKIIELLVDDQHIEQLDKIANKPEVVNNWKIENQDKKFKYSLIVEEKNAEMMMDNISKAIKIDEEVEKVDDIKDIMFVSQVEGLLPKIKADDSESSKNKRKNKKVVDRISTEEMYDDIYDDSRITQNFLLNVILSSIVCSIGIIKKDMSILIAASAIAPFLGSIMGYSFSLSIGDNDLLKSSTKTLILWIFLSMSIGIIIGFMWNYLPNTYQIDIGDVLFQEMKINKYTFFLALASGASAALAITVGTPTIMASFMLSVSLLPNITMSGITLGNGLYKFSINSILVLAINIICIIFTSQIVFIFKKIKPKTKEAVENYRDNNIANIVYCIFILIILIILQLLVRI